MMTPQGTGERRPLLLVVDDDRITRMTLAKVLSKAGYEVIQAENGLQGVESYRARHPDMVLMDVMMPVMDGYAACAELREIADHQAVPILMLTGLNDMESIDRAFESGATDFITKPINWMLFTQRVRYALRSREMATALRREQERLSLAQRIARLGYWELDLATQELLCSRELLHLLGLHDEWNGRSLEQFITLVHTAERARVSEMIAHSIAELCPFSIDHRVVLPDGSERYVTQQGRIEHDAQGRPLALMGTVLDITARKQAEEQVRYQTLFDPVTDLPNRRYFREHLEHGLLLARQQPSSAAVLFLGLDRFKVINDTLGHALGDALLQEMARRLKAVTGESTTVARFAADVFAIFLEGVVQISDVDHFAAALLETLNHPFALEGQDYYLTASVGIALFPVDCQDAECLLKAAEAAMYRAKEGGGAQFHYYTADLNARAHRRLTMESDLRRALERHEFRIFYQPQVDAATRRIVGMEALLRWLHPERGLVSPGEFIPVAEESGLIVPIGEWVLRNACRQTQQWNAALGRELRIGVNLSARQFMQPGLLPLVEEVVRESGLPPELLDLEVTESIAMQDMEATIATLQALHQLGVRSSMDDFGTGYSSLSYLQRLPLHTLKIDRAFVKDIRAGENGAIAKAIIAMAHSLELEVIAEGVESEDQMTFLREQGCDIIQGFLISKPLPAEEFVALL